MTTKRDSAAGGRLKKGDRVTVTTPMCYGPPRSFTGTVVGFSQTYGAVYVLKDGTKKGRECYSPNCIKPIHYGVRPIRPATPKTNRGKPARTGAGRRKK